MTATAHTTSVFVGVDTHADLHHAAVVDPLGRSLADHTFPTTSAGYADLARWCAQFGRVLSVGIEGTSSYGAALTRQLREGGMSVVEVDRPDRKSRRMHGKTDALDAYSAARAVAAGRATAVPKAKDGLVESIRCLHVARRSAVKARTQAVNQIRGLITTGPVQLREQTRGLGTKALITTVARLRPVGAPAAAHSESVLLEQPLHAVEPFMGALRFAVWGVGERGESFVTTLRGRKRHRGCASDPLCRRQVWVGEPAHVQH